MFLKLEDAEAIDERFRVVDPNPPPGVPVHEQDEVVDFERPVRRRRGGRDDDLAAPRLHVARSEEPVPGALAALALVAHVLRHRPAFAARRQEAVLSVVPFVKGQPVDPDLVPNDVGVVRPALPQFERLREPLRDGLGQHRLLPLRQRRGVVLFELGELLSDLGGVLLLLAEVREVLELLPVLLGLLQLLFELCLLVVVAPLLAPQTLDLVASLQLYLALDRGDVLHERERGRLVHLGPGERVVREDGDVVLAAHEARPLAAAILCRVGLARF